MKNIASIAAKLLSISIVAYAMMIVMIENNNDVPEEPEVVAKPVDIKQWQCLAENIYYEAGSESITGKAAVARVVMNRVRHGFASTPCNVIYQTTMITKINEETLDAYKVKMCQFSWVCENKKKPNMNDPRYIQAKEIAYEVLAYDAYHEVLPRTALFFHNLTVDPFWPYKQVAKIGNHIFYSKQKVKHNEKKPTEGNI
jgi:spore germination cell wall hydrolase CwlJ-like protein